ncbi:hypothetical protein A3I27_02910 [Candidatus Giovannonibacteria bacterium RIFCSPLOWO2_02_FULL_43_11b]|uniref:AI-2E family transporter n=1 Tax=Candidatus Giovannonibacteria bacterium RIFCSPHIGHO2_12_FULL_43_15 TaxID=1798341 RepID=A0A1F5WQZ7_9BACT|nr:MAG: hypothetical protein A2739_03005 [Candidatus Giovannonibacteria bacterium RIFCSPHIGHO2_01_FULL_43_100]OGF66088.1 MAG: hypothetical protein A3B97_01125 [Candidatus Giovannonibacteria bacterium RIFCSPHIGHO2_02_FULL_43_32]OGF78092.1 MAG: hypothetical protein A3F23_02720 [Candidatus Giovannonibacteria bacterium RIFCSPHIGHO2_12_FULL_43_15]OGF78569.1 MAG: hypothetical protein A3A15_02390 [Candidatus Giovannonibacteria bacterium RIFCSPLOWO2_01_FULL_43_60]OGF89159.1 MAG: hypothetical protein A3
MNGEKLTIDISTLSLIKVSLFVVLAWLVFELRGVIGVLLASVVIASSVEPATRWLSAYKIPRVIAVIFVYLAAFTILGLIFYLILPPLVSELGGFLTDLPDNIQTFEPTNIFSFLPELPKSLNNILRDAILNFRYYSFEGTSGLLATIAKVFGGAVSFIMIIVISFYLSVEERGIENFLKIVTPKEYEGYALDLWNRSRRKIGLWFQGQLLLGVLVGVLAFLGLTILGVKYALLLAILSGILEIIPVFGPIISAVPAIGVAFTQKPILGLAVLILYVIIQQFENHLIYPLVVRKTIGIPPLLVILSIFIGGVLAGFFGIMLAVPVATVLVEFINDFARRKQIEF